MEHTDSGRPMGDMSGGGRGEVKWERKNRREWRRGGDELGECDLVNMYCMHLQG